MQSRRIAWLLLALASGLVVLCSTSCHAAAPSERGGLEPSPSVELTCPPGAEPRADGCACRSDLRVLLGACVSARTAAAYCGPVARAGLAGCVPLPPCEPGRARDLASGECLSHRDVRNLAASLGILVADDERVGCPPGSDLVAVIGEHGEGSPRLGCLPRAAPVMARRPCPAASLAVAARSDSPDAQCVRIVRRAAGGGRTEVDVARWVEAAIGADGGSGAPPLCSTWSRGPVFLGSATPTEARFAITLRFADNDVSLVVASVRSVDVAAAIELERELGPMLEGLRALGGTASQASVTTTIRCVRSAGPRPLSYARDVGAVPAVPTENDHER